MSLFSTSLLARGARRCRGSRFDPQGVYEFAFNVVPIGDDTVFAELKTLGPDRIVELVPRRRPGPAGRQAAARAAGGDADRGADRAAPRPAGRGRRGRMSATSATTSIARLSGGLDSRLVLAALRAEGCRPHVYVYGGPDERRRPHRPRDRRRRRASRSTGSTRRPARARAGRIPRAGRAQLPGNMTACPIIGELFENGMQRRRPRRPPRRRRALRLGRLRRDLPQLLLPARPAGFGARPSARTFFARYARATSPTRSTSALPAGDRGQDPRRARPADGERARLPRALIEQVYPRVRCRAAVRARDQPRGAATAPI